MSVTGKSFVFLGVAFVVSWAIVLGAHYSGAQTHAEPTLFLALMMTGPAIAALICTFAFEKGRRVTALGLHFKPNWWWALAWALPIAIAVLSVVLTLLLSDRRYIDLGDGIIALVSQMQPEAVEKLRAIPFLGAITMIQAVTLGAVINMIVLTFTEELGWRGYLYDLWRPSGFWRTALATGVVWGVWHAPAIYFYGLNYPDNPALGVLLFIPYCVLLSVIITLVRERAGSTWAAGLFHGLLNAVGGLTLMVIDNPAYPWNGIVGIGGFLALAIGCAFVVYMKTRTPAPAQDVAHAN